MCLNRGDAGDSDTLTDSDFFFYFIKLFIMSTKTKSWGASLYYPSLTMYIHRKIVRYNYLIVYMLYYKTLAATEVGYS